jgi:hypothetical protein
MTLMALSIGMIAIAAPASVQAQTGNAYGGEGQVLGDVTQGTSGETQGTPAVAGKPQVAGEAQSGESPVTAAGPAQAVSTEGSSLPFTGFDVLLLVAGGLVLIGVGAAMRRMTPTAYE